MQYSSTNEQPRWKTTAIYLIFRETVSASHTCIIPLWNPEGETKTTRSTQRAQTSLAEADHYSHIAHCKNVEPWL